MAKAPAKKPPRGAKAQTGDGFDWQQAKEEAQASSNPNIIKEVRSLARKLIEGEKQIEDVEKVLSELKTTQNHLKTVELPDKMDEAQLRDFTLDDGFQIVISPFVSGSLPKEEKPKEKAIKHLIKLRADSIIKTTVTISFGREEHEAAQALFDKLVKMKYEPSMNTGVHPQTLMAWAREALEDGVKVDLSTLGLTAGRIAKAVDPETAKPKRKKRNAEEVM